MTAKDLPTPATLRKLLSYDPDTGLLTWKYRPPEMFATMLDYKAWNARFNGKPAFATVKADGYLLGRLFYRSYRAHRIAYAIYHGAWPTGEVDHKNGVRSDNRITNLRDVTRSENQRNAAIPRDNSSGHIGVSLHTPTGRWRARIAAGSKQIYLGLFENFDDAVAARAVAEVKYGYHPNHGRPALA